MIRYVLLPSSYHLPVGCKNILIATFFQPLFVREFGLFSTTFRRVDGQEIIAPNALLASAKLIHNLRRSNSMWETTKLMVSYDTPLEKLEELRNKISAYVQANNRDWSGCALNIDKMEYQNAIHLIVAIEREFAFHGTGSGSLSTRCDGLFCRPSELARLGRTLGAPHRVHEEPQDGARRT